MTESVDKGDVPQKNTTDGPAEAQDQPRENEREKQLEKKQSTDETTAVQCPPNESGTERDTERDTTHSERDDVKAAEPEQHLDVPKAKESKVETDERIKLARRRRRCPVVDVDRYISGGAGEMKEGGAGKQRTLAQVIMQEDITGLMQLLRGGASASETDSHGWNPLHWSSSRGSTVMTHIILQETKPSERSGSDEDMDEEGASNRSDYLNATEGLSGWTPLHLAAIGGHVDVIYLLMEAGCDARVQDRVGDRPINCIKRATNREGGLEARLRNALLDLSDSEGSSGEDEGPFRSGDHKRQPAPRTRDSNRERRRRH